MTDDDWVDYGPTGRPNPPPPELKTGETVCQESVRRLWSTTWPAYLLALPLAWAFCLWLPAPLLASALSLTVSQVHVPMTLLGLGTLPFLPWAARRAVRRQVTNASCRRCGYCQTAEGLFDCDCGEKIQLTRHLSDPCTECHAWASHVRCPWCGADIEVWGDPPGSDKDEGRPRWPARRLSVTKPSASRWPN